MSFISPITDSAWLYFLQAGAGAVTRSVQSKLRDVVSVKDFGAVGDGVSDDTLSIQNAVNFAATTNGSTVYIPVGQYKISNPGIIIPTGVSLIGDSSTPVGPGTVLIPADASVIRMIGINGTDICLENILILGEATKSVIGVDIGYATVSDPTTCGRLKFKNVVARLCKWGFHTLNGAFLVLWDTCTGWDCKKGWFFDNTGTHLARGINIGTLMNCHGVANDEQGMLAVASLSVNVISCGFDSEAEGIRAEDVGGLYVATTTMDLSSVASFSLIGTTFEIYGCFLDQPQLGFTIQTGTNVSKGSITHCRTTGTVGAFSVVPDVNQWIDFVENTFDKPIQNDGQRFGHGDRTEANNGTVVAAAPTGQLVATVTFSRAFSALRSVQVTPTVAWTFRFNYQLANVTTSGFQVYFTRDDGTVWNAGEAQDFYWTAIGAN